MYNNIYRQSAEFERKEDSLDLKRAATRAHCHGARARGRGRGSMGSTDVLDFASRLIGKMKRKDFEVNSTYMYLTYDFILLDILCLRSRTYPPR